jgi:hypothetical protein
MGKLVKMNGVEGHLITPEMRNIKKVSNPDFSILKVIGMVIFSPFLLIFWVYKLLIKFPNYRSFGSHITGLFRVCFWGYLFWVPNHKELFEHLFISQQWQLSYPLFTAFTFIMTGLSILVFLGLSKSGLSNAPIHDDPNETNIGFTVRQIDWRLSNQTQRNKFIDKLFKD